MSKNAVEKGALTILRVFARFRVTTMVVIGVVCLGIFSQSLARGIASNLTGIVANLNVRIIVP